MPKPREVRTIKGEHLDLSALQDEAKKKVQDKEPKKDSKQRVVRQG